MGAARMVIYLLPSDQKLTEPLHRGPAYDIEGIYRASIVGKCDKCDRLAAAQGANQQGRTNERHHDSGSRGCVCIYLYGVIPTIA